MKVFLVRIDKGQLNFGSDENIARWRQFLKDNDEKWLRIALPESKRSGQQNRYYWFYLELVARETGDDPVSLHEYFKKKLLPPVTKTIKGKSGKEIIFETETSTTDLNKVQMGEYLDRISSLTDIPLPDTKWVEMAEFKL